MVPKCTPQSHIGAMGPDNRSGRISHRPWNKLVTWERTPLGLETAAPVSRAARAGCGRAGKTLKSPPLEVPALHREAERDTTVNFGRQHHVHTWIDRPLQGRRRPDVPAATLRPFRRIIFKARLTQRFYCGKRAARRHGFVGGPRKSPCITGFRAVVRRNILVPTAGQDRRG